MTRKQALQLAAALAGAALLSLPASRFRLEIGCSEWPSPVTSAPLAAAHLLAVALLAIGWLGWWREAPRPSLVLAGGAAVHALALAAPPFLSMDPIFYAAIGRAMARFGASPHVPLSLSLPHDDPFFLALGVDWQHGTSAYFAGFHQLARAIALVAGDSLALALRLYQVVGALAMLASAALVSRAVEPRDAGRAAAAVLLCPLSVVEATQAGHNDALIALGVAAFALATVRARPFAGLVALHAGLAIKLSAILLVAFDALALCAARFKPTRPRLVVVTIVALVLGPSLLAHFTPLLEHHCARSLECLARDPLYRHRFVAAARAIGVAFRAGGTAWLLWTALFAGRDRPLAWAGLALCGYFTFFHAYWQAWYLLPLVPLLPFSDEKWRPALIVACLSAPAHYAVVLAGNCVRDVTVLRIEEWADTAVAIFPTAIALVICRRSRSPSTRYR